MVLLCSPSCSALSAVHVIIRGSCDYSGWTTVQKLSEFTGECNNSNDCSGSGFYRSQVTPMRSKLWSS